MYYFLGSMMRVHLFVMCWHACALHRTLVLYVVHYWSIHWLWPPTRRSSSSVKSTIALELMRPLPSGPQPASPPNKYHLNDQNHQHQHYFHQHQHVSDRSCAQWTMTVWHTLPCWWHGGDFETDILTQHWKGRWNEILKGIGFSRLIGQFDFTKFKDHEFQC